MIDSSIGGDRMRQRFVTKFDESVPARIVMKLLVVQVLAANCIALIWNVYLSYASHN